MPSRRAWARANAVLAEHRRRLLRRKGVRSVDVGLRLRRGRPTDEVAIRVHVEAKPPCEDLPPRSRLPEEIDGVLVDVIEGTCRPLACPAATATLRVRRSRLRGGYAIGRWEGGGFGTIAALAADDAGAEHLLTAQHVIAGSAAVVQPAGSGSAVGTVSPLGVLSPWMDAGLVNLDGSRKALGGLHWLGMLAGVRTIRETDLPLPVRIVGACSGRSRGQVTSIRFDPVIEYPSAGRIRFRQQLHIAGERPGSEFSQGGDSGALVVDEGTRAVGLLFAGEGPGQNDHGVATPIGRVLDRLRVAFV